MKIYHHQLLPHPRKEIKVGLTFKNKSLPHNQIKEKQILRFPQSMKNNHLLSVNILTNYKRELP